MKGESTSGGKGFYAFPRRIEKRRGQKLLQRAVLEKEKERKVYGERLRKSHGFIPPPLKLA